MAIAIFAAGCFWGVEAKFRQLHGIIETQVGYCGGHYDNPTYPDVCRGDTGHAEAIQIQFDDEKISYEELLRYFWKIHDPTTLNRQGPDVGSQYRSVVFFHDQKQRDSALAIKRDLTNDKVFAKPIVTEIVQATTFFPAEDYHQRYFEKQQLKD